MSSFNCNSFTGLGRAFYVYRAGDVYFVPLHRDNRNKRIYGYAFNGACAGYVSADIFVHNGNEYFNSWFPDFEHWLIFSADSEIAWMP